MAKDRIGQGVFPPEPGVSVTIESPNGLGRIAGPNRVTVSSYEPGRSVEKLPYRDTVTGRYTDRR